MCVLPLAITTFLDWGSRAGSSRCLRQVCVLVAPVQFLGIHTKTGPQDRAALDLLGESQTNAHPG